MHKTNRMDMSSESINVFVPIPDDRLDYYFDPEKPQIRAMCPCCGQIDETKNYFPWAFDTETHDAICVYKCSKCGRINHVRD